MITIGVTGHRRLAMPEEIGAAVERALQEIEEAFADPAFEVLSMLAEGADRLVVRRLLARGRSRLVVPLPMPVEDYVQDFKTDSSKAAFRELLGHADRIIHLPPAETREQAYAAGGTYVLDHCGVLIAIWDGKPARGIGGTGEIASEARRRGLPMAWILAGSPTPDGDQTVPIDTDYGRLRCENFPHGMKRSRETVGN